jgi:hypothetical protein
MKWEIGKTRAVGIISATPCNVIVHSTVNRAEEIEMMKSRCSMVLVVGLLAMVGLLSCNQETPIEKTKAAAVSGSAATQAAGQASVDAIQSPLDKARQVEGTLEQSAEQRAAEAKKATE